MPARIPRFLTRRPPPQTLEWAAAAIGDGARVVSMRRLRGGMSSAVHALTIEDASSARCHRLVLRRFVRADWLAVEPDLARHEATALVLLEEADSATPLLVAFDELGTQTDVPAVLMTRLEGRIDLAPMDRESYLRTQAEVLPRIHTVRGDTTGLPPYRRYYPSPSMPPATTHPEVWRTLIEHASKPPHEARLAFIHRDYHPGNVLWSRGRLIGVVDWVNACIGPPEVDVGHARWNLAQLFGVEAADAFLDGWLAATGRIHHDPYWDIVCLLDAGDSGGDVEGALEGWRDGGRTDLSLEETHRRRDEYALSLARRL